MYLALDHELIVVQVTIIRSNTEVVTHILTAQTLLTGHQGLEQLLAVTSADDVRTGIAEQLLNSLGQIADGRGIRLLDEQITGICMLESEQDQIHSLVQVHQKAGHVGVGDSDGVTSLDLVDEQRDNGTAAAHNVAVAGAADDRAAALGGHTGVGSDDIAFRGEAADYSFRSRFFLFTQNHHPPYIELELRYELQFPTPGLYAKRKNLLMGSNPIIAPDSEMLWNAAIVWRILRRYEYTGALVMGRRKKIDVNTTSIRTLPEDKWIIAENAHEAIVTKDEYYQAQKAIRNVTPIQYKVGDDFALKGKICCGNCKRQLRHEKQYGEMVFCCGYKRAAGKFSKCYGGYYREYSVNAKVARAIKTVFYALDVVNQGMQEKQSITVRCVDIEDLEKQAEAIRVEQIKLYESYADGVLRRDVYIEKKKALSEKLATLQDSIRIEKEEQECADELDEEIRALTKQASEKTYIGGLTKECVDAFVSMVYLYDDQTMKIEFNCEDVIRRALEKYGA